jgi:hypothetical protein
MEPFVTPTILSQAEVSEAIRQVAKTDHHSDEDGHHIGRDKPNYYLAIAQKFTKHFNGIGVVDPFMIFYHLSPNYTHDGSVDPHRDLDFEGQYGIAKYSMLIHLNNNFKGGETMFENRIAPEVPVGAALVFPHSLLHSGKAVTRGSKFILKTDIFV